MENAASVAMRTQQGLWLDGRPFAGPGLCSLSIYSPHPQSLPTVITRTGSETAEPGHAARGA